MSRILRAIILATAAVIVFGWGAETRASDFNVVLVVVDGTRQSETVDDPDHAYIPHIWNDLRPRGAMIANFRNEGKTLTNPGHSSILTGTWQQIANDGSERPTEPTLFEYYRRHHDVPAKATQIVAGKEKIKALNYSTHADYGADYAAVETSGRGDDRMVFDRLIPILERDKPSLVLVCFPTVDDEGHDGDWDRYVAAIAQVDSMAFALWTFLENDAHYAGKTYMFITNDHGRHVDKWGFSDHGCSCDGCERLLFLALGPDIRAGYAVAPDVVYTQRDLCNTVARILDFPVERSKGHVIEEIFEPIN